MIQNFFECIDLSDNEIKRLENFSYLDRLNTLILTNNRIKTIHGIAECLPNLENLFLMNNKISDLREVAKLGKCRKLQRLVLINNSVTQQLNYRPFVISRIPSLKILDFNVVTAKERRQAEV